MKLLILYLYALKNAGHFEFVHSILEFALRCAGITTHLADWLNPFKDAVDEEERLLGISLKNVITEQLVKIDGQRDGLVSSIHGATNAMLKSVDAAKQAAAQSVMNELTSLKVDIQDSYMNQTGQIDTLVTVLLGKEAENVSLLGLTPLVQELKSVNDLMHSLMNQRDEEQMDRMNDALAKARLVTDATYNDLVRAAESYTFLHATELADDDLGFTKFFNDANARVEYFRRYVLKQKQQPAESEKEEQEEEEVEEEVEEEETIDPSKFIQVNFKGPDNKLLHTFYILPDGEMSESQYPTPPEGTHWNFTLADLNLAIGMKNPGDTITVRAQA